MQPWSGLFMHVMGTKQTRPPSAEALFLAQQIEASGLTRKEWYNTIYLRSDHWEVLRGRALIYYGRKCLKCPATTQLQVHHLNYRNIYDVILDDLQVLCMTCHHKEHPEHSKEGSPRPPKAKVIETRAVAFDVQTVLARLIEDCRESPTPELTAISVLLSRHGKFIAKRDRKRLKKRQSQLRQERKNTATTERRPSKLSKRIRRKLVAPTQPLPPELTPKNDGTLALVTFDLVLAIRTPSECFEYSSWNARQLQALGVGWPPKGGWTMPFKKGGVTMPLRDWELAVANRSPAREPRS